MTDNEKLIAALETGFASVGSKLESQVAVLGEKVEKVLTVKPEDIKSPAELAQEKADLEAGGALSGIINMEVWDIPVGQAIVGGFVAVFASELIDGFLIKQGDNAKGLVKLVGAGVAAKWGKGILGNVGSKAVALLLAYDGVRSLLPIDEWASKGSSALTGMLPGGGLGGFKKNTRGLEAPANNAAAGYYDALKGGVR